MLLNEIFENRKALAEWGGVRGFGGYGQSFFRRAHYVAIANLCCNLPDALRPKVSEWFAAIFAKDNHSFKPDTFLKACETGARKGADPRFQMRHFYYLAELIKDIPSEQMKVYMANTLADYFDRSHTAENFNRKRWYTYCDIADPDAKPDLTR